MSTLLKIFVRSRRDWEKKCRIGIRQCVWAKIKRCEEKMFYFWRCFYRQFSKWKYNFKTWSWIRIPMRIRIRNQIRIRHPRKSFLQCCGSGSESGSGSTGSTCFWASRIRILLSSCKTSKKNLDSYYFVTLLNFLSLKNDVNVASKGNKQKKLC